MGHYTGSPTVPPCGTQVRYYVRQDPVVAAHGQLRKFAKILKDTCAPNGNFRLVQPASGVVTSMPSVDVVRNPADKEAAALQSATRSAAAECAQISANDFGAEAAFSWEDEFNNAGRIRVGDADVEDLIEAKENYNRAQKDLFAAQRSVGSAALSHKYLKTYYESLTDDQRVEKINNKWALQGAEAVLNGAKASLS